MLIIQSVGDALHGRSQPSGKDIYTTPDGTENNNCAFRKRDNERPETHETTTEPTKKYKRQDTITTMHDLESWWMEEPIVNTNYKIFFPLH